jgi:hypothetical protein
MTYWRPLFVVWSIGAALATLDGVPRYVAFPVLLGFMTLAPGLAIVARLRLGPPLLAFPVAVALSFSLDVLVALVLLYAGAYEPRWVIGVLAAITVVAALARPTVAPNFPRANRSV